MASSAVSNLFHRFSDEVFGDVKSGCRRGRGGKGFDRDGGMIRFIFEERERERERERGKDVKKGKKIINTRNENLHIS